MNWNRTKQNKQTNQATSRRVWIGGIEGYDVVDNNNDDINNNNRRCNLHTVRLILA